ncbi:hypothetical protein XA68_17807 [Ophiocordyceps unilateralis]|uniref:Uncharacterized protein n=1 Tax=Ophiocordyceps unilateralis TaxID=268505 RepID=A0A2A9P4B8_OPHUN|nr:hypothetical protein XA68_17807 [Ophiocordyceps unilateralis]
MYKKNGMGDVVDKCVSAGLPNNLALMAMAMAIPDTESATVLPTSSAMSSLDGKSSASLDACCFGCVYTGKSDESIHARYAKVVSVCHWCSVYIGNSESIHASNYVCPWCSVYTGKYASNSKSIHVSDDYDHLHVHRSIHNPANNTAPTVTVNNNNNSSSSTSIDMQCYRHLCAPTSICPRCRPSRVVCRNDDCWVEPCSFAERNTLVIWDDSVDMFRYASPTADEALRISCLAADCFVGRCLGHDCRGRLVCQGEACQWLPCREELCGRDMMVCSPECRPQSRRTGIPPQPNPRPDSRLAKAEAKPSQPALAEPHTKSSHQQQLSSQSADDGVVYARPIEPQPEPRRGELRPQTPVQGTRLVPSPKPAHAEPASAPVFDGSAKSGHVVSWAGLLVGLGLVL